MMDDTQNLHIHHLAPPHHPINPPEEKEEKDETERKKKQKQKEKLK